MNLSRKVPGEGNPTAKIAIVGEAPGEEEEKHGRPFIGASGHLLDSMLMEAGINRYECYVTNLVKYRPTANNFDLFYLDGKKRTQPSPTLLTATQELFAELDAIRPNLVLLLGGEALRHVAGKRGIIDWRGSVLPGRWGKLLPSLHPAYVLRQYPHRALAVADFRRAARESLTRDYRSPGISCEHSPVFERAMSQLRGIQSGTRLAFDIETLTEEETKEVHVRSLGLAWTRNHGLCIPFMRNQQNYTLIDGVMHAGGTPNNSYWTVEQEEAILQELWRIFQDNGIQKIAHNYPFDAPVLERYFGLHCRGFYMDTMLAMHTCMPELPKDLGTCTSLFTDIPCYWDVNHKDDVADRIYNCYDAVATWQISYAFEKMLDNMQLRTFHEKKARHSIHVTRMSMRGMAIDERWKQVNFIKTEEAIQRTERIVRERAGNPVLNLKSSPQMQDLLYVKLGLPEQYDRKTGNLTVGAEAITKLLKMHPEHGDILAPLAVQRQLTTMNDRFLGVPSPPDRAFRTALKIATVNGRLSSSEPLFDYGTNLQNIKRGEFRKMFCARAGKLLIKADLAQAEFRWVVWRARILRLIEKYHVNPFYDVYRFVASLIFGVDEGAVTDVQRYLGKVTALAANYDMQAGTMAAINRIPFAQAKFALDGYHREFPEIGRWWADVRAQVNASRQVSSPFGWKRTFLDRIGASMYRDAYNAEPQHAVAFLINEALSEAEEQWDYSKCQLLMQIHDELVAEADEDKAQVYALDLKGKMERPVVMWPDLPPLVIPAEVSIGPNWFDQKKVKHG